MCDQGVGDFAYDQCVMGPAGSPDLSREGSLSWAVSENRRWRFHLIRGARCLEVGDFVGAQRHFGAAHRDAPDEPIVCLAWGRELLRSSDPGAAEGLLRRAWELDPSLETAGLSLARALGLHCARPDRAYDVLDEVERLHGTTAGSVLLRGEIAVSEPQRYERARALFERAGELGADEDVVRIGLARAYNAEGIACCDGGDHSRALFALKRAADLDPDWAGPLVNSGAIFERMGHSNKAQEQYRAALRLDPVNPVALFNLADALRRKGTFDQAERLFRRLLAVQPDYPGAERGLRECAPRHGTE